MTSIRSVALVMVILLAVVEAGAARAQSVGAFTPTGRMAMPRALHTATLLPNGKVLIAGGRIHGHQDYRGTVTETAELYDPSQGTFSLTGRMATPRARHTATLLPSGKVLIVGRDWAAGDDRTAEVYDPSTETFTRTGDTSSVQYGATATLLNNGKVLIAGGTTPGAGFPARVSTPELYDPAAGTFAATGRFVGPGDGFDVEGGPNSASVTLLSDGRVLFAAEPFSEIYDPATGTFSATGEMKTTCGRFGRPSYVGGRTATLLPGRDVLVAGGGHEDCGRFAEAERYDPVSGAFTLLRPMSRKRSSLTATPLPDGTVLMAGGESESGFHLVTEATAEIYDPAAATFSLVGSSMQDGREQHTATLLKDGRVLLAGGVFFQDVGMFLGSLNTADLYTQQAAQAPVPVLPIDGVVTEDGRPRLQAHNLSPPPFGSVTYRFEWSDRINFGPGPRIIGADGVRQGDGADTAHAIADELEPDTWYYWRVRATIVQPDGQRTTTAFSAVRSFRTPPPRATAEPRRP